MSIISEKKLLSKFLKRFTREVLEVGKLDAG